MDDSNTVLLPDGLISSYLRTITDAFPTFLSKIPLPEVFYKNEFPISPQDYSRNVIFKNNKIEVVIAVWDADYLSIAHNHGDSHCVFVVLSGSLSNYRILPNEDLTDFVVENHKVLNPGNIEKIEPGGFHIVENQLNIASVTLNFYSPPISDFKSINAQGNDNE